MPVAPMARKKKPSFSKVYRPDGWKGIVEMSENPLALRLFAFLCANCDHLNAVVAMPAAASCKDGNRVVRFAVFLGYFKEQGCNLLLETGTFTETEFVLADPADLEGARRFDKPRVPRGIAFQERE